MPAAGWSCCWRRCRQSWPRAIAAAGQTFLQAWLAAQEGDDQRALHLFENVPPRPSAARCSVPSAAWCWRATARPRPPRPTCAPRWALSPSCFTPSMPWSRCWRRRAATPSWRSCCGRRWPKGASPATAGRGMAPARGRARQRARRRMAACDAGSGRRGARPGHGGALCRVAGGVRGDQVEAEKLLVPAARRRLWRRGAPAAGRVLAAPRQEPRPGPGVVQGGAAPASRTIRAGCCASPRSTSPRGGRRMRWGRSKACCFVTGFRAELVGRGAGGGGSPQPSGQTVTDDTRLICS
ncbi:MAG: hypothetical protein MZU95_13815 [Desulfomicrobium escambiense]|nr:hypothetical protein [Desulfomicrobium escambiense]